MRSRPWSFTVTRGLQRQPQAEMARLASPGSGLLYGWSDLVCAPAWSGAADGVPRYERDDLLEVWPCSRPRSALPQRRGAS